MTLPIDLIKLCTGSAADLGLHSDTHLNVVPNSLLSGRGFNRPGGRGCSKKNPKSAPNKVGYGPPSILNRALMSNMSLNQTRCS
jgi:hypothetical protein